MAPATAAQSSSRFQQRPRQPRVATARSAAAREAYGLTTSSAQSPSKATPRTLKPMSGATDLYGMCDARSAVSPLTGSRLSSSQALATASICGILNPRCWSRWLSGASMGRTPGNFWIEHCCFFCTAQQKSLDRAFLTMWSGGGSRMRFRAERCASLLRSGRTLTPTPLPEGEGLSVEALPAPRYSSTLKLKPFSPREKVAAAG